MNRHTYFTLLLLSIGCMQSSVAGIRDILHETKETIKDTAHDVTDLVTPEDHRKRHHRRNHRHQRHHKHLAHRD